VREAAVGIQCQRAVSGNGGDDSGERIANVMADIVIDVESIELVSVITRESAERMGLVAGKEVTAVIKSMEVLVATDGA
jgi:molybdopterin-binding protein